MTFSNHTYYNQVRQNHHLYGRCRHLISILGLVPYLEATIIVKKLLSCIQHLCMMLNKGIHPLSPLVGDSISLNWDQSNKRLPNVSWYGHKEVNSSFIFKVYFPWYGHKELNFSILFRVYFLFPLVTDLCFLFMRTGRSFDQHSLCY